MGLVPVVFSEARGSKPRGSLRTRMFNSFKRPSRLGHWTGRRQAAHADWLPPLPLDQRAGLLRLGLVFLTATLLTVLTSLWRHRIGYRVGEISARDIRVPRLFFDRQSAANRTAARGISGPGQSDLAGRSPRGGAAGRRAISRRHAPGAARPADHGRAVHAVARRRAGVYQRSLTAADLHPAAASADSYRSSADLRFGRRSTSCAFSRRWPRTFRA